MNIYTLSIIFIIIIIGANTQDLECITSTPNNHIPNQFCSQYSGSSCCSVNQDANLGRIFSMNLQKFKNASDNCIEEIKRVSCGLFCEPISRRFRSGNTISICDSKCYDLYKKCYNSTLEDVKISAYNSHEFCSTIFEWNLSFLETFELQNLGINKFNISNSTENISNGCFNGGVFANKTENIYRSNAIFSTISGNGVYEAIERQESEIHLTTLDDYGNHRQVGGDNITITLGTVEVSYKVQDLSNGKYIIRYIPSLNGAGDTTAELIVSINQNQLNSKQVLIKETTYCVLSAPVGIPFNTEKNTKCSEFYSSTSCCTANEVSIRMSSIVPIASLFNLSNATGKCLSIFHEFQCAMFCDPRQSLLWYDGGFSITESFCSKFYSACQDILIDPKSSIGDNYDESQSFCSDLNESILKILVPTFFSPHPVPVSSFDGVENYPVSFSELVSIDSKMKFPPHLVNLQLENDVPFKLNIRLSDAFKNPIIRSNSSKKATNQLIFEIYQLETDQHDIPLTTSLNNSILQATVQGLNFNASLYIASLKLDGSLNVQQQSQNVQGFPALLNILPGPLSSDVIVLDSASLYSNLCGYPSLINLFGTDSFGNKLYYPLSNSDLALIPSNSSHFEYSSYFNIVENLWYLYYSNYDCDVKNYKLNLTINNLPIDSPPLNISTVTFFVSKYNLTGTAGVNYNFTIKIQNGSNIITNTVSPILIAQMYGPNDSLVYQPSDFDGNVTLSSVGEYLASLYSTKAGTYNVNAQLQIPSINTDLQINKLGLKSIDILGSPFSARLLPQPAQCQYTTATGLGLKTGCYSMNSFVISSKDKFGNLVSSSNLTYAISFSQGGRVIPSNKYFYNVRNESNGLFSVNYTTVASFNAQISILCSDPTLNSLEFVEIDEGPYNVRFPLDQDCLKLKYCSGNGACVDDRCLCSSGYTGTICQIPPPPKLVSARFSLKLVTLELEFDRDTNKAGTDGYARNCSYYLDFTTLSKFTDDNSCYWRDAKTLVIFPGTNTTILPNNNITFLPSILKDKESRSGFSTLNLSLPLEVPSNVNPFNLTIISPTIVGHYTSIVLDISASLGTGGRRISSIVWSAVVEAEGTNTNITKLNEFLKTQTSTQVTFLNKELDEGIYNFTVSAKNFLGFNSTITFPLSVYNITKTQVNTGVSNVLVVGTSSSLSFMGQVTTPCFEKEQLNFEHVNFAWVRTAGDFFQVDTVLSTEKNFLISASSVPPQSKFDLEFGGTVDDSEKLSSYDKIKIIVQPSLFPIIKNGNQRISRIQNLTLDATPSLDPGSNYSLYNWEWTCKTSTFEIVKNCLERPLFDEVFKNSPVINIPPATLWFGNHTIFLTIKQKTSVDGLAIIERSHSINLNLEIYDAPIVNIFSVSHDRISRNERLSLNVTLYSLLGNDILGVNVTFDPPINQSNVEITRFYGIEVKSNTFQPGIVYNITVTAEDRNGLGSASLPISINEPPMGGYVDVSTPSQNTFEKNIKVSFTLWEDDYFDYPLSYNVGYIVNDENSTSVISLLNQPVLSHIFNLTVPIRTNLLQVDICDSYGACTTKNVSIPAFILSNQVVTIENISAIMDGLNDSLRYGDSERALSILQLSIQFLNNDDPLINSTQKSILRNNITEIFLGLQATPQSIDTFAKTLHDLVQIPQEITDSNKLLLVFKMRRYLSQLVNELRWDDKKFENLRLFLDSLSYLRNVSDHSYAGLVDQECVNCELLIAQSMLTPKLFGSSALSLETTYTYLQTRRDSADYLPIDYSYGPNSAIVPRRLLKNSHVNLLDSIYIVYSSDLVRNSSSVSNERTSDISAVYIRDAESRNLIQTSFDPTVDLFNFTETFVPISEVRVETVLENHLDTNRLPNNVEAGPLRCAVWNDTLFDWSEEGCSVVSSDSQKTTCQCDSFGETATFQQLKNVSVIIDPPFTFTESILTGHDAILIAIIGGIALFIIIALIPLRRFLATGPSGPIVIVTPSGSNGNVLLLGDIPTQTPLLHQVHIFSDSDLPGQITDFEAKDY